jgi:hypothetical protein
MDDNKGGNSTSVYIVWMIDDIAREKSDSWVDHMSFIALFDDKDNAIKYADLLDDGDCESRADSRNPDWGLLLLRTGDGQYMLRDIRRW